MSLSITDYGALAVGLWLGGVGVFFLSELRHPQEQRKSRWGRRGKGPPCTTPSIVAWGLFFFAIGVSLVLKAYAVIEQDAGFMLFLGGGFIVLLVCGIRDTIIEDRRRRVNRMPSSSPSPH